MSLFSATYEEAREALLTAADAGGFRHLRFRVPHEDSAELFLDFLLLRRDPKRVLLHFAGVHGVEGYAGSAVQRSLVRERYPEEGPTLLFVHAVNPYGMKFYRRANGQNVDLNRNFRAGPAAANPDYALFADYLHPPAGDAFRRTKLRALWRAFRVGRARAPQAIAAGQVGDPRGLFYMGDRIQREIFLVQDLLRSHCGEAETVLALDLHTGLGPAGAEQLFVDHGAEPDAAGFVREVFGAPVAGGDNPAPYENQGRFSDAIRAALPKARVRYVMQEFGARSALATLDALRLENFEWHRRPPEAPRPPEIERAMMDAFCPESESWRARVIARGRARWAEAEAFLRKAT